MVSLRKGSRTWTGGAVHEDKGIGDSEYSSGSGKLASWHWFFTPFLPVRRYAITTLQPYGIVIASLVSSHTFNAILAECQRSEVSAIFGSLRVTTPMAWRRLQSSSPSLIPIPEISLPRPMPSPVLLEYPYCPFRDRQQLRLNVLVRRCSRRAAAKIFTSLRPNSNVILSHKTANSRIGTPHDENVLFPLQIL